MKKHIIGILAAGILGIIGVIATVGWTGDEQWHECAEVFVCLQDAKIPAYIQHAYNAKVKIHRDGVAEVKLNETIYCTHISNILIIEKR